MTALIVAEPPGAYARRPRIVVDASVLASAIFREAGHDQALALLRGRSLCAPHLLDYEIANVALQKARRGFVDDSAASEAMRLFAAMDLDRFPVDALAVMELAASVGLGAYDASYLWLAAALGAPLATFDQRLGAAALHFVREQEPK